MKQNIVALVTGVLFGLGLALAQMTDRSRVLNFMDLAGAWDPTLLFVLGGATGVTLLTFRIVLRWRRPLLARTFAAPTQRTIDRPLVLGSVLFGIGWGISGYCPGPGIAALAVDWQNPLLFMLAFVGGVLLYWHGMALRATPTAPAQGVAIASRSCG